MTLEKLTKQLRRDMAANPKKAAALGLMVLVALYFWGPLLWKLAVSSGSERSASSATAGLILTDDPAEPTQQSRARGGTKFRWDKVRQLIQGDPHMQSAVFDATWTDPFARSAARTVAEAPVEATQPDAAALAAAALEREPAELEIVLNGIFVGTKTRVATINGEPRYEGELVALGDKDDKATTYQVRVARITRQAVVLELNGKTFAIELSAPKLARGDEIERKKVSGN